MPKIPGISHERAVKAFEKAGIIKDAGLIIEEFKELL